MHALRHAYPTGLSHPLQACGDVDPVTKDVTILLDDVAHIDANAEFETPVMATSALRSAIPSCTSTRAAYGIDNAGELGQQPIAGRLHDPAAMLGNARVKQLSAMAVEASERAFIIDAISRLYPATSAARIAESFRAMRSVSIQVFSRARGS